LRYAFSPSARPPTAHPRDTPLRPTDTAAVVGAGTMGGGIAMSFADFGYPVKIMDATQEALDRGMQRIRGNYETSVKRGSLTAEEMEQRLARIEPVQGYDAIGDCDVVIEAVFEQIPVKRGGVEADRRSDETGPRCSQHFRHRHRHHGQHDKRPQDVAGRISLRRPMS
jgi:3-hydroxyacyl-CoA dehydrogenase